jgi:hypothetical protein
MLEKTEFVPLLPATDTDVEAAPPEPTVTGKAVPGATAKPAAVKRPPAPPPPALNVEPSNAPPPPPPATTRYSTVAVTPLVSGLKVADI